MHNTGTPRVTDGRGAGRQQSDARSRRDEMRAGRRDAPSKTRAPHNTIHNTTQSNTQLQHSTSKVRARGAAAPEDGGQAARQELERGATGNAAAHAHATHMCTGAGSARREGAEKERGKRRWVRRVLERYFYRRPSPTRVSASKEQKMS